MEKHIPNPSLNSKPKHKLPTGGSMDKLAWAWRQHITAREKVFLLYVTSRMGMEEETEINFEDMRRSCGLEHFESLAVMRELENRGLATCKPRFEDGKTFIAVAPNFSIRGSL